MRRVSGGHRVAQSPTPGRRVLQRRDAIGETRAMSAKAHGRAVAWTGGGGALAGLLVFTQSELHVLNLATWPLFTVTAILVLTGLALAVYGELRVQQQAETDRSETLDAALACWPPRRAADLSPYDVGVRPSLRADVTPWPYLARKADGPLREALERSNIVIVFGPAGAGKSRTAFQSVPQDAVVLVPEHAEGLAVVLKQWRSLGVADEAPVVLWLDGLERYAPGLDVDPIIAFLEREPTAGWSRRLRFRRASSRTAPASVKLVATIREEKLQELLEGDMADAHSARRLCSAAEGVFVSGELTDAEQEAFVERYGFPPEGRTAREAFGSTWRSGWRSPPTPGRRESPSGPRLLSGALAGLTILIVVAFVSLGFQWGELTVAPPIKEQVADLVDEAKCPVDTFPADAEGLGENSTSNRDVLIAIEHGGDCGASDTVRFYRNRNGRLREASTLAPAASMGRQEFSCVGVGPNPCHVDVAGKEQFILGQFKDARTHQELPVAVSFEEGGLRVWPLTLPGPKALPGVPESIEQLGQRLQTIRLQVGGTEADSQEQCRESFNCSRGRTAQATAVMPAANGRPAVLLAGYTNKGTIDSPENVLVRMWNIALRRGVPRVERDCVVLHDGLVKKKIVIDLDDNGGIDVGKDLMKRLGGEVMC